MADSLEKETTKERQTPIAEAAVAAIRELFEFAALLIVLFVGVFAISSIASDANITISIGKFTIGRADIVVSDAWKYVLVLAGTLCIGFGAAALFYGNVRAKQSQALRAQFLAIRARADLLVAKFDEFERSKPAP